MRKYISFPKVEGETSRQAHADLPAGTYEREIGRDGFFGPATHLYHRHPPTGWTSFEGPLRPRAFDCEGWRQRTAAIALERGAAAVQRHRAGFASGPADKPMPVAGAQRRRRRAVCSCMRARAISSAISAISPIATATTSCCRAARCGGLMRRSRRTVRC